jgi:O-antigen ligase
MRHPAVGSRRPNQARGWRARVPDPLDVLAVAFCTVPPIAVLADKATVPTLLVTCVAMLPGAILQGWRPRRPGRLSLALVSLIVAWAAVSASWSFDPPKGWATLVRLLALVAAGWAIVDIAASRQPLQHHAAARLVRAAAAGVGVGLGVLIVELALDHPIVRTATWEWAAGAVTDSDTNRGFTILVVVLFMTLPLARRMPSGHLWAPALVTLTAVAAGLTDSGANIVGLLLASAFVALAWLGWTVRLTIWVLAGVCGLIAMPWLAQAAFEFGLHRADWVPSSAQHRVHIWNFVSQWALERPLTGWGFDSSSDFGNRGVEPFSPGYSVIPLHPHNAALQIWLELGIVGVLLTLAGVARVVRGIDACGADAARWVSAAAMATCVIADIGYGAWQTQWTASILWFFCYAAVLWPPEAFARPIHEPSRGLAR